MRTVTHNPKCAHSKALESGWLSRFYTPPFDYDTVSHWKGKGHGLHSIDQAGHVACSKTIVNVHYGDP